MLHPLSWLDSDSSNFITGCPLAQHSVHLPLGTNAGLYTLQVMLLYNMCFVFFIIEQNDNTVIFKMNDNKAVIENVKIHFCFVLLFTL